MQTIRPTAWLISIAYMLAVTAHAQSLNGFRLDDAIIPIEEIKRGGPPRDGIPSLDDPDFISAKDAGYMKGRERVLGIDIDGEARAYPIRILNYHEVVNDEVAGQPISVTYCPLCGSGTAFRALIDEHPAEFGVSGLLYNSGVLLYDRETGSLWSQLLMKAITGPMKGTRLMQLPLTHTRWRDWKARYPDTLVLSNNTGHRRNYRVDPYADYARSGKLISPVTRTSDRYRRKEVVMGLEIDGRFKAYPFKELSDSPANFSDSFADATFTVEFDDRNDTARILNSDGDEIATTIAYWFAWYAFHPDTDVYEAP